MGRKQRGRIGRAQRLPPPKIDEAPTFDQYGKLAQLFLISTGEGGPGSVADGKTVLLYLIKDNLRALQIMLILTQACFSV